MCAESNKELVDVVYRMCYAYINKNTDAPCKMMETESLEAALVVIHKYDPSEYTGFIENEIERHYEVNKNG